LIPGKDAVSIGLGIVLVEVCDRNGIMLLPLDDIERKYPEAAVMKTNCLDDCNLCRVRPFALVNGRRLHAETGEQCMKLIEEAVKEELELFFGG